MSKIKNSEDYLIKEIVKALPRQYYYVEISRPTNETFRRVFNFLAKLWITARICRTYYRKHYMQKVEVNHRRRIMRAFKKDGVLGIRLYLHLQGMHPEAIDELTKDFTHDKRRNVQAHSRTGAGQQRKVPADPGLQGFQQRNGSAPEGDDRQQERDQQAEKSAD